MLSAPEQLCVNVTSTLLHLFKETQASWQSDFKNQQKEKDVFDLSKKDSTTIAPTPAQSPSAANVQQGLALLHTVRLVV